MDDAEQTLAAGKTQPPWFNVLAPADFAAIEARPGRWRRADLQRLSRLYPSAGDLTASRSVWRRSAPRPSAPAMRADKSIRRSVCTAASGVCRPRSRLAGRLAGQRRGLDRASEAIHQCAFPPLLLTARDGSFVGQLDCDGERRPGTDRGAGQPRQRPGLRRRQLDLDRRPDRSDCGLKFVSQDQGFGAEKLEIFAPSVPAMRSPAGGGWALPAEGPAADKPLVILLDKNRDGQFFSGGSVLGRAHRGRLVPHGLRAARAVAGPQEGLRTADVRPQSRRLGRYHLEPRSRTGPWSSG